MTGLLILMTIATVILFALPEPKPPWKFPLERFLKTQKQRDIRQRK